MEKSIWGKNIPRIIGNMMIVLVSLFIGMGICEVVSRIFFNAELAYFVDAAGKRTQLLIDDKELGFVNKPNFDGWIIASEFRNRITINKFGFRGGDNPLKNNGNKLRIMAIGDSFTFGIGVEEEETYIKKLESCLRGKISAPIEGLNFGVGAYGTIQEYLIFQKFRYLKPDLVILGFLARNTFAEEGGNDLVDNYNFYYKNILKKEKQDKRYLPWQRTFRSIFRKYSNLYRIVEFQFGGYLRKKYSDDKINIQLRDEAWIISIDFLKMIDSALKEEGIKGILLWVPFPGTVEKKDFTVLRILEEQKFNNLFVINPMEGLASKDKQYYYSLDGHWNKDGHAVVGKILCEEIITKRLLYR